MTVTIAYLGADAGYQALVETLGGAADAVHVEANPNALSQALETASGLLDASMAVPISDAMIYAAPNLKIISCATTGADHIARDSAQAKGITIHTLREDADWWLDNSMMDVSVQEMRMLYAALASYCETLDDGGSFAPE